MLLLRISESQMREMGRMEKESTSATERFPL